MDLTVFAFAFLDKGFILDVFVTSLTIIPRPGKKRKSSEKPIKTCKSTFAVVLIVLF